MTNTFWYFLRMSRWRPPGLADDGGSRSGLYRAALQQFEDLLNAAANSGPAGSPLPLYYALSQAGRAILAAYEDDAMQVFPAREHHGLAITLADDPTDLLGALIKPVSTSIGQFQRVSAALNSPGLTVGTELGALLASLPENGETWLEDRWPVAVGLEPLMNLTRPVSGPKDLGLIEDWGQFRNGRLRVAIMADAVQSAEDLDVYATQYPTLAARDPELPVLLPDQRPGRVEWSTPYGNALEVHLHVPSDASDVLSAYTQALDELAPQYRWLGRRWLRPAVEGSNAPPGPLMTWWAILYALSMLARYHPVEWTQALDRDKAASAVVLERLLDLALEALPHLVFEALLSPASGALLPPGPDATPVSR